MHSTDRRAPSITFSYRRAEMTAFWGMCVVSVAIVAAVSAWAIRAHEPWAWALAGFCVLIPRLVWPRWYELGITVWNRGVRLIAQGLRTYTLKVSYYLVFVAVGRAGSSLDVVLHDKSASRWIPRSVSATQPLAGSRSHARRLEGAWVLCLLPVLWFLRLLSDDGEESAPLRSTYTLY
jgi:hypothetical protein